MKLDEAIKHCHEKAQEIRKANEEMPTDCKLSEDLCECAKEHEQLAGWLKELKEWRELKLICAFDGYVVYKCKEIDNAPTVEPRIEYGTDGQPYKLSMTNGKEYERPQGEWEEPFEMNGKTYHKCNHCHISSELILIDKFCPNCGADMRGKE